MFKMLNLKLSIVFLLLCFAILYLKYCTVSQSIGMYSSKPSESEPYEKAKTVYDFTVKDINGNNVQLDKYKGHVLIIVNVASQCGLTSTNYQVPYSWDKNILVLVSLRLTSNIAIGVLSFSRRAFKIFETSSERISGRDQYNVSKTIKTRRETERTPIAIFEVKRKDTKTRKFWCHESPTRNSNDLYDKYAQSKGLRILAFPCNQFLSQEPGTAEEILTFTKERGVKFDLFDKVDVNGDTAHPLWKFLKQTQSGTFGDFIKWNFSKFIVDKNGVPVERVAPNVNPSELEPLLAKYW